MTFRTTVRDGMININTHGELPDGTPVEVFRVAAASPPPGSPRSERGLSKKSRGSAKADSAENLRDRPLIESPAIGMWKDRKDWQGKSTLQIARELRKQSLGGRGRG